MATPAIVARDLVKEYDIGGERVAALAGVSLEIDDGDFVAIMGPSGSGKSTFMNILGCLDRPTRGRYLLAGEDTGALDANALARLRGARLGFVFQAFHLLAHASALENVELPLTYADVSGAERRRRAEQALAQVGLGHRARHKPAELSAGQQQRVAIARALVNDPRIVLADEPTGALDQATGVEIMGIFAALNRQGRTIVLITHDNDVGAQARRRVRFRDGRIVADEASATMAALS